MRDRPLTVILRLARRAPLTLGYVSVLTAGSLWLTHLDPDTRHVLLQSASTNLSNLEQGRWSVLAASAVVVTPPLGSSLAVGALVLAAGEVLLGTRRAFAAFVGAHVLASLAVTALLQADALPGVSPALVASAVDVGFSYGVLGVAGALAATRRSTPVWLGGLLAFVASDLVLEPLTFTAWGHLFAAVTGVVLGMGLRRAGVRRPGTGAPGSVALTT